jgi:uncharacterized repeat protein (TIGR01451 family)
VTLSKTANVSQATIGNTVRWTLTGTVPSGFIAYWPVIEEDTLPNGFDYVPGSAVITGAALDTANHADQPNDNGNNKLYWFLQTLDNRASAQPLVFTIKFDTLVTGVNGTNVGQVYYNNYCCLEDALNKAYARWYETASGAGNNSGVAGSGGRRSGAATYTVKIRQPKPTIVKSSTPANVEAGDLVTHTLTIFGAGNDIAYEVSVEDLLPEGTTFVETVSQTVTYPFSPPPVPIFTHTDTPGATNLSYQLNTLYVGSTWSIIYTTRVDDAISAGRTLTNTATLINYSSQPGSTPDTNSDGLPDERVYTGPSSSATQYTPAITVLKEQSNPGELTFGSTLVYTLTVPATPINATIYDATLTDVLDSRLQVINVSNAAHTGNTVSAAFAAILPNTQQTIVIEATVPQNSTGLDNDLVTNTANLNHRYGTLASNPVQQQLVAPALTLDKQINQNSIAENDVVTYTLLIANVGNGLARNLVVTDQLPTNMSYVSGSSQLNGQPLADPVAGAWA